ncbi:XdhC family protein [Flavisolibacter nicotianae]|uniref:XdhC family protein n=1 Tax=Flavisolibacter nicotianae TaxID=2364882 RepID=UPI000EB1DD4D|nr:XdhC/CoxI family protein [Flavisolibacter nicotianae]
MTKEINDILAAYEAAREAGRQTALATVVHVEGSSYRRPGARMLVEDNGKMTGAISGGCLEGDALRKALLAINQQQNKIVTYDTLHEDDIEFGVQLGCNGIVHILFEPIDPGQANNPVVLLEKSHAQRKDCVLVTLFSLKNYHGHQPGTCFLYDSETTYNKLEDKNLEAEVKSDAANVLANKDSFLKPYGDNGLMGFVELLRPAVSLVLVGAGNDVLPIVDMASILGWPTTIVDGRSTHANTHRFPKATRIIVAKPPEAMEQIPFDEQTVFVLMTHNYNYDLDMLRLLLNKDCRYIGTLGPKKRLERMLAELKEQGIDVTAEQRAKIYGPTGLDIGAEAAEEIALSLLAEIKAVLTGRQGSFLRDRAEGIHARSALSVHRL